LSLAAARASAAAEHPEAERLSLAAMAAMPPDAPPLSQARALHGHGQVLLRAGRSAEALDPLTGAAEMAADHQLHSFAPVAYADLAAGLAAQRRFEEAIEVLTVANRYHAESGNIPGEAATCETLGEFHAAAGRKAEAATAWRYAMALYDRITNPDMAMVREAGQASILEKMHRNRIRHAA
jgi:tetratricopeptide (TPR) repeat protein